MEIIQLIVGQVKINNKVNNINILKSSRIYSKKIVNSIVKKFEVIVYQYNKNICKIFMNTKITYLLIIRILIQLNKNNYPFLRIVNVEYLFKQCVLILKPYNSLSSKALNTLLTPLVPPRAQGDFIDLLHFVRSSHCLATTTCNVVPFHFLTIHNLMLVNKK